MNLFIVGVLLCCGTAAVNGKSKHRIANQGETAAESEFPYQVSLQRGKGGDHFCGGALTSTRHVLTAGHCIKEQVDARNFPQPIYVEVGTNYKGYGTSHRVKRVSYYRGFYGDYPGLLYPSDIAMIHLAEPVQLSARVGIINLPAANTPLPAGTRVILSGFGTDHANGPASPVLKKLDAAIVSLADCDRYFTAKRQVRVSTDKICAARGPGYGACQGDSGGPLVDSTRTTILGVVSAGDLECFNGQPDTYTDVSQFLAYINEELAYTAGSASPNPSINFDASEYTPVEQYPAGYPGQQLIPGYPQGQVIAGYPEPTQGVWLQQYPGGYW